MKFIRNVYSRPKGQRRKFCDVMDVLLIVILIIAAVAGILSMFVFYQRRDK